MAERSSTPSLGANEASISPAICAAGHLRPGLFATSYSALGLAWIVYSNGLLSATHPVLSTLVGIGREGGTAFVLITGLLVYGALKFRALEAAAQSERIRTWRLLAAIADSSSDAIYAKDQQGRYLFVNREVCRLMGRSSQQLLGTRPTDSLPPHQIEKLASDDATALRSARPIHVESTLDTIDG